MTWTNAFDVGPCHVQLQASIGSNVTPVWDGVLGKGESHDIPDESENTLTVAVSSLGVLSVSSQEEFAGRTFNLTVQPIDFGAGSRISNVLLAAGAEDIFTSGFYDAEGNDMGVELVIAAPCSPNPSTFPSIPVENADAPDVLTPSIGVNVYFSV